MKDKKINDPEMGLIGIGLWVKSICDTIKKYIPYL